VDKANVKKSLIAFPEIRYNGTAAASPQFKSVGSDLYNTVVNDLDVSGYFTFIKAEAFLEKPSETTLKPFPGDEKGFKFENWSKIGAEFLAQSSYQIAGKEVTFDVYVYHVGKASLVMGKSYKGSTDDARRIGHTFANDLVQSLTGKKGMFLSQIVVSSDRAGNGWKEIYVMDWDGQNVTQVSKHKSVAISPTWAPDGKSVVYSAYAYHKAEKIRNVDLFRYDLYSGKRFVLSQRKGINSGASFNPAGSSVYLTISQGGNPDIFKMSPDGNNLIRITNGPAGAMNVEPAISPDGNKIAFSTDRSGKPMIYVMAIDGSNPQRLTYAGKYNATPAWSPDGKKIAFSGWDKGRNDIFIMNPNGTGLERLTTAGRVDGKMSNNEDPTFSPDGRHVMFVSDRTGKKQLYIVNIDGTNERRITVDSHNYFKPKWGWHER
ncbi:MAG: PD40 domain-containing protein, partial [Bdellovibrionales bacterium]|nr:PD40 domain-containing protein [Bdellovibrionales bacterium]